MSVLICATVEWCQSNSVGDAGHGMARNAGAVRVLVLLRLSANNKEHPIPLPCVDVMEASHERRVAGRKIRHIREIRALRARTAEIGSSRMELDEQIIHSIPLCAVLQQAPIQPPSLSAEQSLSRRHRTQ
jgi:hypothetical protein